jgi:hypothetical protein
VYWAAWIRLGSHSCPFQLLPWLLEMGYTNYTQVTEIPECWKAELVAPWLWEVWKLDALCRQAARPPQVTAQKTEVRALLQFCFPHLSSWLDEWAREGALITGDRPVILQSREAPMKPSGDMRTCNDCPVTQVLF